MNNKCREVYISFLCVCVLLCFNKGSLLVAGTKRPQFAVGQPIARVGPADAVLSVLLP